MGKAHLFHIIHQFVRQLFISEPKAVFQIAPPRAQMHFINADGPVNRIGAGAVRRCGHFFGQAAHHRSSGGAQFRGKSIGVGFLAHMAAGIANFKFIQSIKRHIGHKNFPHADIGMMAHYMAAAVPIVEFTDHRHALRIRRPHAEMHAFGTFVFHQMRTQRFIRPQMRALAQQPRIQRLQARGETVSIVHD